MKRFAWCPLIAVALGSIAIDAHADDAKKAQEQERFQGTWVLVSGEKDGKAFPKDALDNATLVVKGNTWKITDGVGTAAAGTVTYDMSKSPGWMDSVQSVGPDKGKTWQGIYRFNDDGTQTVCLAPPGKERPTKFESLEGSGLILQTWKKE